MKIFYKYNPELFYYAGPIEAETCPENATEIACWIGNANRYSKWEGTHWNEYEILESGEHVVVAENDHTKPVNWFELTDIYNEDGSLKEPPSK